MAKDMYQKRRERKQNKINNTGRENKTNINWYPGHMAKSRKEIIEKMKLVDIVLEVVDARMPYSSRIKDIDLMAQNKPHLIVMSKADLCDMNETKKWVKKFESEGKHIILTNLMDPKEVQKEVFKSVDMMMNHQNNKREDRGMLKKIPRVLVVGIPNVGKSTLINALVGRKAAGVGNTPGVTRQLSWIRVQNHIDLLDTPGILYPRIDDKKVGFNLAAFSSIKETILPVEDVAWYILKELSKYYPDILKEHYGITDMDDDYDVIYQTLALKRGFFKRGGVVDYDRANVTILSDIRSGNISGITFDRCTDE